VRTFERAARLIKGQGGRKPGTDPARLLEQKWLKEHEMEHRGDWVALEGADLVASGSSARQVLTVARAKGFEHPLVVHIPAEPELPFGGW
jgi:hypothetical protein